MFHIFRIIVKLDGEWSNVEINISRKIALSPVKKVAGAFMPHLERHKRQPWKAVVS